MRVAALIISALLLGGCSSEPPNDVIVYTSQDQFYAEPILREFSSRSAIQVLPVFDTESAKTAGLANRLRQEAAHPRCDVFWSNEEMHARVLAAEGVLRPENLVLAGYRTRRLVVNTNLMSLADAPADLLSLTNAIWKGRIALAYPLYGTTSSHFLALRQKWGEALWTRWCEGLLANDAKVVDGNSVVVRLVGAGEAWIGLTDSDDVAAGKRAGLPVEQAPFGPDLLVIPSTIAIVAPDPREAVSEFVKFLTAPETIDRLVQLGALEGREPTQLGGLSINWSNVQSDLAEMTKDLKGMFLRT